jgi:ADP-ribose pyrophosphatase YjhB (NUDIX family)
MFNNNCKKIIKESIDNKTDEDKTDEDKTDEYKIHEYKKDNVNCEDEFIYLDNKNLSVYNWSDPVKKSLPKSKYKNIYCVNCGEKGHVVKECDGPITSFGIIAFKIVNSKEDELQDTNEELKKIIRLSINKSNYSNTYLPSLNPYLNKKNSSKIKFLMIQRKDTMGFTDFVRGKYPDDPVEARKVLLIFLNEMTNEEKLKLLNRSFDYIWNNLWVNHESKMFKNEYELAHKKFQKLDIKKLVNSSNVSFNYTEFGFPKGRRNMKETNIACAEREFLEETGFNKNCYDFIKEYPTILEEFVGTNGVTYKHIYYLVKMKDNAPPPRIDYKNKVQTGEVQNIGWFSYEEAMSIIRPYDIAKKSVIQNVYNDLIEMNNNFVCSNFYYTSKKQFKSTPRNINYPRQIPKNYFQPKSI